MRPARPVPFGIPWRRWLHLGPSRTELVAERDRLRHERDRGNEACAAAQRRAEAAEDQVRLLGQTLSSKLNEPAVDGCTKVRLHTQDEADTWTARLADSLGEPVEVFNSYRCTDCPRHPATGDRFWHVGHKPDATARRSKAAAARARGRQRAVARRDGTDLGSRIDPRMLDRIRRAAEQ